jgi:hypothetical protein
MSEFIGIHRQKGSSPMTDLIPPTISFWKSAAPGKLLFSS